MCQTYYTPITTTEQDKRAISFNGITCVILIFSSHAIMDRYAYLYN